MLLVMGLASQMVIWDDDFCEQLADRGFWVIRFDNRDIGRSTILRDRRPPKTWQLIVRDRRGASYTLGEMADDAVGLLDQLGVERAHVVGVSMGGMIAQLIAIRHRDRVLSLVSIMSTTGNRRVGRPHPRLIPHLLRRARTDREGYISDFVETYRVIGSSHVSARPGALARHRWALLRSRDPPRGRRPPAGRDRDHGGPHPAPPAAQPARRP